MMSNSTTDATNTVKMYCVKCRTMIIATAPQKVVLKNDRHALKGACPHCSTATYKIIPKE
jgi:RNase P subunit RPR2